MLQQLDAVQQHPPAPQPILDQRGPIHAAVAPVTRAAFEQDREIAALRLVEGVLHQPLVIAGVDAGTIPLDEIFGRQPRKDRVGGLDREGVVEFLTGKDELAGKIAALLHNQQRPAATDEGLQDRGRPRLVLGELGADHQQVEPVQAVGQTRQPDDVWNERGQGVAGQPCAQAGDAFTAEIHRLGAEAGREDAVVNRRLETRRLNLRRPRRAWVEWLRPLFSLRQAVFNP